MLPDTFVSVGSDLYAAAWLTVSNADYYGIETMKPITLTSSSGTSATSELGNPHGVRLSLPTATPATYTVTATCPTAGAGMTKTGTFTVVGVSEIDAVTTEVVLGTPITFTAILTFPTDELDAQLQWTVDGNPAGVNGTRTFTLLTDSYGPGEYRVTAFCGNSSKTLLVKTYGVTGVSASSNLVAAGESITFTATTVPDNCPFPVTWSNANGTGLTTADNSFPAGNHLVTVKLGTTSESVSVTSVGVKEIQAEWPLGSGNWLPWGDPTSTGTSQTPHLGRGESFRVKAIPEPSDATFPANWPEWSGAASGMGQIATATFGDVSTTVSDFKTLTATCGTSSNTVQAVVYRVDSISVTTNHVAIGTNTLTLTPVTTPATGAEFLVWLSCTNASLDLGSGTGWTFPCSQSGSFTVTAHCGPGSVSTNINVYELTGVSISANPVAVGATNLTLTATVEPAGGPLQFRMFLGTNDAGLHSPGTPLPMLTGSVGEHDLILTLGSSTAWTNLWTVGVKKLEYQNPQTSEWDDVSGASHELLGTKLSYRAIKDPEDAPSWPVGFPMWKVSGAPEFGPCAQTNLQFDTVSPTMSHSAVVKARCGTSDKSASTIVFTMTLINVPAEWPDRPFDPSEFGLCESVVVSNNVVPPGLTASAAGVQWTPGTNGTPYSGSGILPAWDGMIAYVNQVWDPETIEFKLHKRNKLASQKNLKFIAPTDATYVPLTIAEEAEDENGDEITVYPGPLKPANSWNLSKAYDVFIQPAEVSFSALFYKEGEVALAGGGVDQGGFRSPRSYGAIGIPVAGSGGPVDGIFRVDFVPNLLAGAAFGANPLGWQSATVPFIYIVFDRDGDQHEVNFGGGALFQGVYSGQAPYTIQFQWKGDTVTGDYASPLP